VRARVCEREHVYILKLRFKKRIYDINTSNEKMLVAFWNLYKVRLERNKIWSF
jgi:hypothetical protein